MIHYLCFLFTLLPGLLLNSKTKKVHTAFQTQWCFCHTAASHHLPVVKLWLDVHAREGVFYSLSMDWEAYWKTDSTDEKCNRKKLITAYSKNPRKHTYWAMKAVLFNIEDCCIPTQNYIHKLNKKEYTNCTRPSQDYS